VGSFFDNLGEILANLPEHPMAVAAFAVLLLSVLCLYFFRNDHSIYKLVAFGMMFCGGAWIVSEAMEPKNSHEIALPSPETATDEDLENASDDNQPASKKETKVDLDDSVVISVAAINAYKTSLRAQADLTTMMDEAILEIEALFANGADTARLWTNCKIETFNGVRPFESPRQPIGLAVVCQKIVEDLRP
jgi:hypothetical protein